MKRNADIGFFTNPSTLMEPLMTPAYMPFTYLPTSTAIVLTRLVGPMVVYQPSEKNIPDDLRTLASQGLVKIRVPVTHDSDRVGAALAEFTEWMRNNPATSTPGAGFFGARQGEIPFFDENAVNRIRSEINRYRSPGPRADESEAEFSARLFLAVAQENDLATDHLDHDLNRFNALENDFLDTLTDDDDAAFPRKAYGATLWREDPGAKLTGQRIRAWFKLAAAAEPPELLVTTSASVMDTLMETHGETLNLARLADIRIVVPPADAPPPLGRVLGDLAAGDSLQETHLGPFTALAADAAAETGITVTLFGAANRSPATVIGRMSPAAGSPASETDVPEPIRHTLFLLVEC
jgi:hypothetical protein